MVDFKELLPIGSVVMLNGAQDERKVMIFGVRQFAQDEENQREFDYIGVIFPFGNMGPESQILFDHDTIDKVVFRGYENEETADFIEKLSAYYKEGVQE